MEALETREKIAEKRRRIAWACCALVVSLFGGALGVSRSVVTMTSAKIFRVVDVPPKPVAVVFGARVRRSGELSSVLEDRVRTAVELYRSGKVRKLLMTGDNSRKEYDEPTAMKEFAVLQGIPERDIALDYAGFRTYDSCYRARAIFGVKSAILVTQRYHLPRALYTAQAMGLDAVGCVADRHRYGAQRWFSFREQWSTLVAWLQVNVTKPKPHFLGPPVELFAAN